MNNTEDRRVRKTKKALREGLAELMREKDLRNITVRELTDKVDIHRATFYAHYKDIYDLYEQMEDMIVAELSFIVSDSSLSDERFFEVLIDYIFDNSKICRMFLDKKGNRSFLNRVSVFLEEKYLEIWKLDLQKHDLPEEWYFGASYHVKGCLALVGRWAENDFVYSKEKLANMIMNFDTNFNKNLFQLQPQG